MYISRVEIDGHNRRKIRDLTHLSAIHNWVETSFPDEIDAEKRSRKLWRIDRLNNKTYLLLVSKTKPNVSNLERYGVENSVEIKNYQNFIDKLQENQKMMFRIVLNPTKSEFIDKNTRGRTVPCLSIESQMQYLIDRSEKNGFSLKEDDFSIVERGYGIFRKKGEKQIKLVKATYEGLLTISDLDKFKKTLCNGFGKKKAYGFGLMTAIDIN